MFLCLTLPHLQGLPLGKCASCAAASSGTESLGLAKLYIGIFCQVRDTQIVYYLSCHIQLVIFCVTLNSSFKCPSYAYDVCGCLYSFTELYLIFHSLSLSCSLSLP